MCGGELSHDKNDDNKGTLIRFLQAAAPNLPGGFIPKALPMSRLQSIISQCRMRLVTEPLDKNCGKFSRIVVLRYIATE